jgi:hypothetical protein
VVLLWLLPLLRLLLLSLVAVVLLLQLLGRARVGPSLGPKGCRPRSPAAQMRVSQG